MNQMANVEIQLQTVLYHNDLASLHRSLDGIANAVRVAKNHALTVELSVVYGDASKSRLFTEEEASKTREEYKEYFFFHYIPFDRNTGTAAGHNLLAKECGAPYIMIMNPDILVNPRIFSQLLRPHDEDNDTAMSEARQTPVEHHKEYDVSTGETSWASTACTLIRRTAFDEIGGFDADTFFMYCDDLDFSWRLRLAGYRVIYCPDAVVFHDKRLNKDGNWVTTPAERYYSAEAAIFMAYKWSNPKRMKTLLTNYTQSESPEERKAAASFLERQRTGMLPEKLDPEHRIAEFTPDGYGRYRYKL